MALDQPASLLEGAALEGSAAVAPDSGHSISEWLQDPMGSVITASVATIGSFGIVLGGIWSIGLALN